MVEENRSPRRPIVVGYYPVITYQPLCLPPTIYFSDEQIQSQLNDFSTLTKVTPIKKTSFSFGTFLLLPFDHYLINLSLLLY